MGYFLKSLKPPETFTLNYVFSSCVNQVWCALVLVNSYDWCTLYTFPSFYLNDWRSEREVTDNSFSHYYAVFFLYAEKLISQEDIYLSGGFAECYMCGVVTSLAGEFQFLALFILHGLGPFLLSSCYVFFFVEQ